MSYIDREKLLRCLNDNWLAHTPNDNDEKKVRKLKRVFCKGLDMAFDIVKEFPTSEPEDFVPGSILAVGYEPLSSKKVNAEWFCADGERK